MKPVLQSAWIPTRSGWDGWVHRSLPLERETATFVLASSLDVLMTYLLVHHGRGTFCESNPVAAWILAQWGFDGMVYFKFALVALVTINCQVIARSRLYVARRLLHFATLIVTGVVLYSTALLVIHGQV